jgi:hypothetical protein
VVATTTLALVVVGRLTSGDIEWIGFHNLFY